MRGRTGPSAPSRTLDIAASAQVLRQRRLDALQGSADDVVLGRTGVTLRGLAERCAAETDTAPSGWLSDAALERLALGCADDADASLGKLIRRQPGLAGALAATLRDLRDAGVPPETLPDEAGELRRVYRAGERALAALGERGLVDRIGLFRLAERGAGAFCERLGFASAELHGATELVGSAGDLVQAVARVLPLRMFQPDPSAALGAAFAGGPEGFTVELRATWPWSFAPEPTSLVPDPLAAHATGRKAAGVRRLCARGPREELELVAREVLALLEGGARPEDIAVVARSLAPYAAWIEPVFRGLGIPFTSSLSEPVTRAPEQRVWLDLVAALFGDLERDTVLRLLASPRLELAEAGVQAGLARRLSRQGAVVRGDDWSRALLDADARDAGNRRRAALGRWLEELRAAGRDLRAARSFAECAERVLALGERLLAPAQSEAAESLARGAIAATATLDAVDVATGRAAAPAADELRAALEQALRGASWRPHAEDRGGVRILDALQARALPLPHLFLIGLCHGAWPRLQREDPFLPDALRSTLRRQTGRPVPAAERAEREERFLFGLLLSQADASLVLSRPDADAWGRQLAPSSLLGELPFDVPERDAERDSGPGLWTPVQGLVQSALRGGSSARSSMLALARAHEPEREAALSAGLSYVEATDAPEGAVLAYDGVLAVRPQLTRPLSPSFLETMGKCPLRAFFQRVLLVRELDAPRPDELQAAEAGSLVHDLLARLYRALFDARALDPGTPVARARRRARELLPEVLAACESELRGGLRDRHPAVWDALRRQLSEAVLDFVDRDLAVLLPAGVSELDTELELHVNLDGDQDDPLDVRGFADRVVLAPSGELSVGDYKTGRDPAPFVRAGNVVRGTALQVPLYALAAARTFDTRSVRGQVLSVPLRPERDRRGTRARDRELDLDEVERSAPGPLSVLGRLLRKGRFPFREHEGCRYCAYAIACRRTHAASARRVERFEGFADYLQLHGDAR